MLSGINLRVTKVTPPTPRMHRQVNTTQTGYMKEAPDDDLSETSPAVVMATWLQLHLRSAVQSQSQEDGEQKRDGPSREGETTDA